MAKIAIVGHGMIGKYLAWKAPQPGYGHKVEVIATRKKITDSQGKPLTAFSLTEPGGESTLIELCRERGVQAAMLAIPSGGTGHDEATLIKAFAEAGMKVITAGKSALANQYDLVHPYMAHVGMDAACGGGVQIPTFIDGWLNVREGHAPFSVTMVVNATINYVLTRIRQDASPEQVCSEATRLGFAEPSPDGGFLEPLQLIRGELPDVARKLAVVCNTRLRSLVGRTVSQRDFEPLEFTEDDLWEVMSSNAAYIYYVRICSLERQLEFFPKITIGGRILTQVGNLYVAGGFVEPKGSLLEWLPKREENLVHIVQGGEPNATKGLGAGPLPTTTTMLTNLARLVA